MVSNPLFYRLLMPSGRTHDAIALIGLAPLALTSLFLTKSPALTLTTASSYLFASFMFGPDLDIRSCQTKRWAQLRLGWYWEPYRRYTRHRSAISHAPLLGTLGRLVYVSLPVLMLALTGVLLVSLGLNLSSQQTATLVFYYLQHLLTFCSRYTPYLLSTFLGLELGASLHSTADYLVSAFKRYHKRRRRIKTR